MCGRTAGTMTCIMASHMQHNKQHGCRTQWRHQAPAYALLATIYMTVSIIMLTMRHRHICSCDMHSMLTASLPRLPVPSALAALLQDVLCMEQTCTLYRQSCKWWPVLGRHILGHPSAKHSVHRVNTRSNRSFCSKSHAQN